MTRFPFLNARDAIGIALGRDPAAGDPVHGLVHGFGEGAGGSTSGSSSGAQSNTTIEGNTAKSNTTAFSFQDANMPATFKNNAAKTNGTSVSVISSGVGAITTGDYNVLDPIVSANYVAGTHDTTGADAALDADYFPTVSGNCDGTGDTSLVDWVGDSDPFGFVLFYLSTRASRGARKIPAIYSGAVLHPDLF